MNIAAYKEIDERIKAAKRELANCNLCPRRCGVNRLHGQTGYCGLKDSIHVFNEMVFCNEENGLNPSHQIHFTGCNLRCEFCVVEEHNKEPLATKKAEYDWLRRVIVQKQKKGARTLNILGGEPSVNLHGILKLLAMLNSEIKVVWNSNMFYNDIVDKLISGLIDIYLADLKCGNSECAEKLLGSAKYPMVAKMNILKACKKADVIVRHVVLPGHRECCLEPILKWLASEIPHVKLSLRMNYVPPIPALNSPKDYLDPEEMRGAIDLAGTLGLRLIQ